MIFEGSGGLGFSSRRLILDQRRERFGAPDGKSRTHSLTHEEVEALTSRLHRSFWIGVAMGPRHLDPSHEVRDDIGGTKNIDGIDDAFVPF